MSSWNKNIKIAAENLLRSQKFVEDTKTADRLECFDQPHLLYLKKCPNWI